jgi:hypothetical protein
MLPQAKIIALGGLVHQKTYTLITRRLDFWFNGEWLAYTNILSADIKHCDTTP